MFDPALPIRFACPAAPRVSILIPTTNQQVKLAACLRSLAVHLPIDVPCEIIVVLNAATEAVRTVVRQGCQGLKVAESTANLGVAGGYNRARSLAAGEFLVLLHDDVEIGPGWLEALLASAAAHPAAGAIGGRVFHPDGTPQHSGSILWRNGLTSPLPVPRAAPDEPCPVDYMGTCCILVRTGLWDILGGLDEQIFPAYYVDVDLALRLRQLGASVLCDPSCRITHHSRSSSAQPFGDFLCLRNREYFLKKWEEIMPQFEPWSPNNPDAIARAVRRAHETAQRLASQWKPVVRVPPPHHDPVRQEIRHFQFSAEVAQAWADYRIRQMELETETARASFARQLMEMEQRLVARALKIAGLRGKCEGLRATCDRLRRKLVKLPRRTSWQRLLDWLGKRR